MKLEIHNIGTINEGSLELDEITVIAGENDTGKSTVGKLVYSVIKASINYEDEYNEYIIKKLSNLIRRAYRQLRKSSSFDIDDYDRNELSPILYERRLKNVVHSSDGIYDITMEYMYRLKNAILYESKESNIIYRYIDKINDMLNSVNNRLSKGELMSNSILRAMNTEFNNDITSRPSKGESKVQFFEGNNFLLGFIMKQNNILSIGIGDELNYPDVTYIESPMVLNSVNRSSNKNSNRNFDLVEKLSDYSSKYDIWYEDRIEKSLRFNRIRSKYDSSIENINISDIINGELEYSIDDNEFYFRKSGRTKFHVENVASGVKAFGMLDLLLKNNSLEPDSLLIVDEPEVHLHPKWQIEYGRIVCELARSGIKVLISTHSPYIVESINYFSQKYYMEENVNYYATQRIDSRSTTLMNCTNDLNYIFKMLSDPLENLVWGSDNAR